MSAAKKNKDVQLVNKKKKSYLKELSIQLKKDPLHIILQKLSALEKDITYFNFVLKELKDLTIKK